MRARKARGLRALTSYCLPWIPTYSFNQLLYVDGQLHRESYSRNVSPVSFLPSYMLNSSLSFPQPVPAGTRIPKWAYLDSSVRTFPLPIYFLERQYSHRSVTCGTSLCRKPWEVGGPSAVHTHILMFPPRQDSPEVTGTASSFPMLTSAIPQSTETPGTASLTSHNSSDAGAIAGGILGSLLVVALIVGLAAWYLIRRRRARSAPSTAYLSLHGGEFENWHPMPPPSYPPTVASPSLYVSSVSFFLSLAPIGCEMRVLTVYSPGPFGSENVSKKCVHASKQSSPQQQ